jgi:hypothetical protein
MLGAELTGDVRDGSGAGVAQAKVTVTRTETGEREKRHQGKTASIPSPIYVRDSMRESGWRARS